MQRTRLPPTPATALTPLLMKLDVAFASVLSGPEHREKACLAVPSAGEVFVVLGVALATLHTGPVPSL